MAVGTDRPEHSDADARHGHRDVLTRKEAAALLGISLRQLDRLPIPKSYSVGPRSPRYLRTDVIAFLAQGTACAATTGNRPASSNPLGRHRAHGGGDWLRTRLAALK